VSTWEKTLSQILDGRRDQSVRFKDLVGLLKKLGFIQRMGKGDHHIFYRDDVAEIINLQPLRDGKAKPYQVKQVRQLVLRYKLHDNE
jgi:predicted RNA binding protein YcfA (HicA-like mRNA interferase family)